MFPLHIGEMVCLGGDTYGIESIENIMIGTVIEIGAENNKEKIKVIWDDQTEGIFTYNWKIQEIERFNDTCIYLPGDIVEYNYKNEWDLGIHNFFLFLFFGFKV